MVLSKIEELMKYLAILYIAHKKSDVHFRVAV